MSTTADAIEGIYLRRHRAFRDALAGVAGSREAGSDATQEGFARALARAEQYRGGSLEAWVWRIALRCALEERARRLRVTVEEALDPALPDPERDPALADAIRTLPPRRRLIVFLRFFADLSYADIAEACDVSEGTVAAALAQARTALRDALTTEEVGS